MFLLILIFSLKLIIAGWVWGGSNWYWGTAEVYYLQSKNKEARFLPWGRGEPNNANNEEDCVVWNIDYLRWNDIKCSATYPYVCMKDK